MYKIPRDNPWPPKVDLSTLRETLRYMENDLRRAPEFAGVAAAIKNTLKEIDKAEAASPRVLSPGVVTHSRFVPYRP